MSILVVDVGTSGVRGAVVRPDGTVEHIHHVPVLPDSPFPGLVEFDAVAMADAVVTVAAATLAESGPVEPPFIHASYCAGSMTTMSPTMPECCVPQYSAQNR